MSKIKLLSIAVIGLLIINIAIVGFLLMKKPSMRPEGPPPMDHVGRPPMPNDGPKKIITESLHFDKDQVSAFEKLVEAHQISINTLNDSISIAKNNLYQSLQSETFAGKDSLANILGNLQKQVELTHYEHFIEIKKLCKPAQLEDFNKLTKELANFFSVKKNIPPPPGN